MKNRASVVTLLLALLTFRSWWMESSFESSRHKSKCIIDAMNQYRGLIISALVFLHKTNPNTTRTVGKLLT